MTVTTKRLSPQCEEVLQDLLFFDCGITSLEAWRDMGISRLGARIWELRYEHGYEIESKMVPVTDRNGKRCWVKRYRLVGN